jgi:hypothetical protein
MNVERSKSAKGILGLICLNTVARALRIVRR